MRVAIAAAGSGGHVYPALAVADALLELGLAHDDIVFFGGDRMEAATVPAAGYPFVPVEIHGLRRSMSVDNLRLPALVRRARAVMVDEIRRREVGAVVVFGGYVAGPAALAARATRTPLVVHEANAVPGLANRLIARRADVVFTSFSAAARELGSAEVIGSPLRPEFAAYDVDRLRPAARDRYRLDPDAPVLGVIGGSLGARFLNDVARVLAADPGRTYEILHLTGRDHAEALAVESADVAGWTTIPFEDAMVDFYAAIDLALSRGGALTVSELDATHTPAIVVPLPAGRAYQAHNAADLAESGGAVIVEQSTETEVAAAVSAVIADPGATRDMRGARTAIDHGSAARTMARRILEVAHA